MDLYMAALEEISLEGLEGISLSELWQLLEDRQPSINSALDQWTKPFIWNDLALSKYIEFYAVDFNGPKLNDIPRKKCERQVKLPPFWIHDHRVDLIGYSPSYFHRKTVASEIRAEEKVLMTWEEVMKKWGESLRIVASQEARQRFLFGSTYPPIMEEITPARYIILEFIGKARWVGFLQADFQKKYGMDARSSFHHVKFLLRLHMITKQNILLKDANYAAGITRHNSSGQRMPPKATSTKMLHLSHFSNVCTNHLQRSAAKICSFLQHASEQILERNQLRQMCSDIPSFKKIRQWLFHCGYIQYIVDNQIWSADNTNPVQLSHFRASRPCYVSLIKQFDARDVEDDKEDEFLDYIENCSDIEPQLVYEETLHHQAYRILLAVKEKGITMKKLAEVLCIPYAMARSIIRYFDTNKLGRIITVDYLKQKVQKIVAIDFLHKCETIQQIQSNTKKIEQHKVMNSDIKPNISTIKIEQKQNVSNEGKHDEEDGVDGNRPDDLGVVIDDKKNIRAQNLELADNLNLVRVTAKNKISLRHLARKNFILDSLRERHVFEETSDLYKLLVASEHSTKNVIGVCCRKTFRKILLDLVKEGQVKEIPAVVMETAIPPLTVKFYCTNEITETSPEFIEAASIVKKRHEGMEKRREMKFAAVEKKQKVKREKEIKKLSPSRKLPTSPSATASLSRIKKCEKEAVGDDGELTDTDDETFKKSTQLSKAFGEGRYFKYGRFQRLRVLHLYLWKLVYGTVNDVALLKADNPKKEFVDLIQSRHIWLEHVNGLPEYTQGEGWFNVGDIISLMPLELTCRVLGIKCWSETVNKYLDHPKRRLLKMTDLPSRLKFKLLMSAANKNHLDNCVDLLVLLAQMGLIAVPSSYPKVRTEIMLYLRKEAKITDTRYSETSYCHTKLPGNMDRFPMTVYRFKCLQDVQKYWEDLKFICLNTPLGRDRRTLQSFDGVEAEAAHLSIEDKALGKEGLNSTTGFNGLGRNYRSFTVLRDFIPYYDQQDFNNMEPVVFGNGLGAAGFDSIFFAHLSKNWSYSSKKNQQKQSSFSNSNVKTDLNDPTLDESSLTATTTSSVNKTITSVNRSDTKVKKMIVSNLMVKQRRGGKGLKRVLSKTKSGLDSSKSKLERKRKFDQMMAKRFEKIQKVKEIKRKANRKTKPMLNAQNHDETDRMALRLMKGLRVSFTEREDAYILLAEVVRATMKLTSKGEALEGEHPKVEWRAIRDLIHKDIPESKDKTWNAINRRARYIKKYPHSLIVYKTCMAELGQNKEFIESLKCTKENWRDKMTEAFSATQKIYSRHFDQPVSAEGFPTSMKMMEMNYELQFADEEGVVLLTEQKPLKRLKTEKDIRIAMLRDLIHDALTAQRLSSYTPAMAFKVFDAYDPNELSQAFQFYKDNKLISRCRVDIPRSRNLPIATMTHTLSNTYCRLFEPSMPLRTFHMARCFYTQLRDGKWHVSKWRDQDFSRLPFLNSGHLDINYSEVDGGHIAYFFSALINEKISIAYSLNDEMTLTDEEHMKKLQKGALNFQRVAYDLRIEKGKSLQQKRSYVEDNEEESQNEEDVADQSIETMTEPSETLTQTIETLTQPSETLIQPSETLTQPSETLTQTIETLTQPSEILTQPSETLTQTIEALNKPSETLTQPSETLTRFLKPQITSGSIVKTTLTDDGISSITTVGKADVASFSKVSNSAGTVTTSVSTTSIAYTGMKRKSVKFDNSNELPCKKNLTRETGNQLYSLLQQSISLHDGKLLCSYPGFSSKCSDNSVSHNTAEEKNRGLSLAGVKRRNCFTYTSEMKRSGFPSDEKMSTLKEGGLHASRTALRMHRCLTDEKLIPTNAMNTHDALVMNPMPVRVNLHTTPFKNFFTKPKIKLTEDEQSLWKRYRSEAGEVVNEINGTRFDNEEYCELLKEQLHYSANVAQEHIKIIEKVKSYGPVGVTLKEFKKNLQLWLSPCVIEEFDDHLQMLFNFRMLYRVGYYEEVLIHSFYITSWVFRAPQGSCFDEMENKIKTASITKKKKTSHLESQNAIPNNIMSSLSSVSTQDEQTQKQHSSDVTINDDTLPTCEVTGNVTVNISNNATAHQNDITMGSDVTKSNDIMPSTSSKENVGDEIDAVIGQREKQMETTRSNYKLVKVYPWLKLNGELNGILLRRFQELVLIQIIMYPACTRSQLIKTFELTLHPLAVKTILTFLEVNGCIKKHFLQQFKPSLFSKVADHFGEEFSDDDRQVYYLPTELSLLNMTDTNR